MRESPINLRQLLAIFLTSTALFAGGVRAADTSIGQSSIVGRWFSTGQGNRVEMDFARDGNCLITITVNGKSAIAGGIYQISDGKLIIRPPKGDPIVYGLEVQGDSMALSGGNFTAGKVLTLIRQRAAASQPQGSIQDIGNFIPL